MQVDSLDSLFRSRGQQRDEIIKDVLERPAVALVIGLAGQGKSWLGMEMAFAVARGKRFLGRFSTMQGPVLFVGEDAGRMDYTNQCSKLFQGEPRSPDWKEEFEDLYFLIRQGVDLFDTDLARTVKGVFGGRKGLVVLDTMRGMHTESENDSDKMRVAMKNVQRVRDEAGSSVVMLHHAPLPNPEKPGLRPRGSGDIEAASDVILAVRGKKKIYSPRDEDVLMSVEATRTKGLHPPKMEVTLKTTRWEAWWEWGNEWLEEQVLQKTGKYPMTRKSLDHLVRLTWPKMREDTRRQKKKRVLDKILKSGLIRCENDVYTRVTEGSVTPKGGSRK